MNFVEFRTGEVRRISLPCTPVNKGRRRKGRGITPQPCASMICGFGLLGELAPERPGRVLGVMDVDVVVGGVLQDVLGQGTLYQVREIGCQSAPKSSLGWLVRLVGLEPSRFMV